MANEIITTMLSSTYRLDNDDSLFISVNGGILTTSTPALTVNLANDRILDVLIAGTVVSVGSNAISLLSALSTDVGGDQVTILASGVVSSVSTTAINLRRSSETIVNYGTITADTTGINAQGDQNVIENFGQISGGTGTGVRITGLSALLANDGNISGAAGVTLSGDASSFSNTGTVTSGSSPAVSQSGFVSAEFFNSGNIVSGGGNGVQTVSNGAFHAENSGIIRGAAHGMNLSHSTAAASVDLINSGLISGKTAAITVTSVVTTITNTVGGQISTPVDNPAIAFSGFLRLINDGTISSAGTGIFDDGAISSSASDADLTLTNRGLINGSGVAIDLAASGSSGGLSVANHGTIIGKVIGADGTSRLKNWGEMESISFGAGNDVVRNYGTIDGIVSLGLGENLYDGRLGTVTDEVFCNGICTLLGGAGDEEFRAFTNNDVLISGGGDDTLFGGLGRDRLIAGDGNDRLNGDFGFDTPPGGASSADTLTGGAGADIFEFQNAGYIGNASGTRDQITDFTHNVDKIDLHIFMAGGSFVGSTAFANTGNAQVRYVAASGLLSGDVDGNGTVDWQMVLTKNLTLTANDFLF